MGGLGEVCLLGGREIHEVGFFWILPHLSFANVVAEEFVLVAEIEVFVLDDRLTYEVAPLN